MRGCLVLVGDGSSPDPHPIYRMRIDVGRMSGREAAIALGVTSRYLADVEHHRMVDGDLVARATALYESRRVR